MGYHEVSYGVIGIGRHDNFKCDPLGLKSVRGAARDCWGTTRGAEDGPDEICWFSRWQLPLKFGPIKLIDQVAKGSLAPAVATGDTMLVYASILSTMWMHLMVNRCPTNHWLTDCGLWVLAFAYLRIYGIIWYWNVLNICEFPWFLQMCNHLVRSNALHPAVNGYWAEAQRPLLELDQGGRSIQSSNPMVEIWWYIYILIYGKYMINIW